MTGNDLKTEQPKRVVTVNDIQELYGQRSEKASNIVRQLGFAAIGMLFLFREGGSADWRIPDELRPAAILTALGLLSDLLHYAVATVSFGALARNWERSESLGREHPDVMPAAINWIPNTFFALKVLSIIAGYAFIVAFLWPRVFH